jgi:hypothetical protein
MLEFVYLSLQSAVCLTSSFVCVFVVFSLLITAKIREEDEASDTDDDDDEDWD